MSKDSSFFHRGVWSGRNLKWVGANLHFRMAIFCLFYCGYPQIPCLQLEQTKLRSCSAIKMMDQGWSSVRTSANWIVKQRHKWKFRESSSKVESCFVTEGYCCSGNCLLPWKVWGLATTFQHNKWGFHLSRAMYLYKIAVSTCNAKNMTHSYLEATINFFAVFSFCKSSLQILSEITFSAFLFIGQRCFCDSLLASLRNKSGFVRPERFQLTKVNARAQR